jgi:ribosomal protein S20
MTIGSISAAGIGQSVLALSSSSQLQQSLQTLQTSLASGDLNGAQTAFQALQKVTQSLATASGGASSSSSQLTSDLTTLGNALSSGDLSTSQTAFASVQSDLKNSSPSLAVEANAANQSQQLVQDLLNSLTSNSTTSNPSDTTTSLLQSVYGASSLNVLA